MLLDLFVDGSDVVVLGSAMKRSNHGWIAAGKHAEDFPFDAAIFLLAAQFDEHLVAVHRRADSRRRNEDVALDCAALPGVRDDETVTVAVHRETPGDEILPGCGMRGERISVSGGLDKLRALHQGPEAIGELLTLLATQRHLAYQLLIAGGLMRLAFDVLEDRFVGQHERQ